VANEDDPKSGDTNHSANGNNQQAEEKKSL
jgi:hypothetical protein